MTFPILISDNLSPEQATAIYCDNCRWTGSQEDPSDGPITDVASCPACGGTLYYQFEPGNRCRNCGAMDYEMPIDAGHGEWCSRACQLQGEYARVTLRGWGEAAA